MKGMGKLKDYLINPAEVSAYMGTNLRTDLLHNGIIKNYYDPITEDMLSNITSLKDTHANHEKTPIYKNYLSLIKDRKQFIHCPSQSTNIKFLIVIPSDIDLILSFFHKPLPQRNKLYSHAILFYFSFFIPR